MRTGTAIGAGLAAVALGGGLLGAVIFGVAAGVGTNADVLRQSSETAPHDSGSHAAKEPAGTAEASGTAETSGTLTKADYDRHLQRLKKKVPATGFTIVVERPFVVIGDESPAMVRRRAEGTVRWAVEHLKKAYFTKDPTRILDIWLFKDNASYEKHCLSIFNHRPTTPYGFYSESEGALVMNIYTGGGTLVHEIVHPFVASNFPDCPAWLNEGLGSLYEESKERDGQIVGKTNWRLAGLQQAIRQRRVPSFATLCATTDDGFYRRDKGTNYAQARYLCYYLQQHGLLRKFYRRFHADRKQDATGYETLKAILGRDDMGAFQKEWEAYVLKLRFEPNGPPR